MLVKHTIIGISGKMGSGKSTLAKALVDNFYGDHVKFAAPLYEMHDLISKHLKTKYEYQMKPKDGVLLQLLGTEWGRNTLGQNIWSQLTRSRIESIIFNNEHNLRQDSFIVVDDCRFDNELDMFISLKDHYRNWNILTIRLDASEEARKPRTHDWRPNTNHPSEIGLDHRVSDFDIIISTEKSTPAWAFNTVLLELEKRFP